MAKAGRERRVKFLYRIYRRIPSSVRAPIWSVVRRMRPGIIDEVYYGPPMALETVDVQQEHVPETFLGAVAEAIPADAFALLNRSVARIERILEPAAGRVLESVDRRVADAPSASAEPSSGGFPARVLWDLRAAQNPKTGERGIARYVFEHASAFQEEFPGVVDAFATNGALPVPGRLWPLVAEGRLRHLDDLVKSVDSSESWIWYQSSPVEMDYSTLELWPKQFRVPAQRTAVTCYDLIPALFPDVYLRDRKTRAQYNAHLELVRQADRVLCISKSCADDVMRVLDVPAARVEVIGTGVSEWFQPEPADATGSAWRDVRDAYPKIAPNYVLFPGGMDGRKNFERTIEAYGRVDRRLRAEHHLVYVCSVTTSDRQRLEFLASRAGVASTFHVLGFVPDDLFLSLYRAAMLVWFPSTYEGFGLPVVEALACHTPVLCADSSSLIELLPDPSQRFDPFDVAAMAAALERGIRTPPVHSAKEFDALVAPYTWSKVAGRTREVLYELSLDARRLHPVEARKRWAFVTPWPPARSGVAGYSRRLISELGRFADVTVFAPTATPGAEPIEDFDSVEASYGSFDHVIAAIGNSDHHIEILDFLRAHPGRCVVQAHDVRLLGLYACSIEQHSHPGELQLLERLYGHAYANLIRTSQPIDHRKAERLGHWFFREIAQLADSVVVHNPYAADVVRLECPAADILVVPLAVPVPPPAGFEVTPGSRARTVIVSMGVVSDTKDVATLIRAFAIIESELPDSVLVLVGPGRLEETSAIGLSQTRELRDRGALVETGDVSDEEFWAWLRRADIAVQLRATTNGEASGAIADGIAVGAPMIFTDNGPNRALPADCGIRVPLGASALDVAAAIRQLLAQPERADALRAGCARFSLETTFKAVAEQLATHLSPVTVRSGIAGLANAR